MQRSGSYCDKVLALGPVAGGTVFVARIMTVVTLLGV